MGSSETQSSAKVQTQKHGAVTWVDVQRPDAEVFAQLERDYHLHPVQLRETVQKVQHTQVEREKEYLFFVLHFPVLDARSRKITIGQVGIFLGKGFLITIHTIDCPVIRDMLETSSKNADQAEVYFDHGADHLLYAFIAKLLSNISTMTDVVVSELDGIEDIVFENSRSDAQRIGRIRQKIVRLRRVIGPKRIILDDLAQQIDGFTGRNMAKYYSNNTKTANKLWEVIEEAKETVEIFKDADFTTSTEQTNRILAILTLIFTFTIPVTVVGALYGMNVLLPGSVNGTPWTFFGRYTTFGLLLAVSIFFAVAMYWYFKKKKWF